MGALVGVLVGLVAPFLPQRNSWLAGLAVALPAGLILGAGVSVVLQRRGPFLGADLVDAAVTAFSIWLAVAVGLSGGLLHPGWVGVLQWSWLVAMISFTIGIAGYVALVPAGKPDATAGLPDLPPTEPEQPVCGAMAATTVGWPVGDEPSPAFGVPAGSSDTASGPVCGAEPITDEPAVDAGPPLAAPVPGAAAGAADKSAGESGEETPDESMDTEFLDEIKKKWSS